LSCSSVSLFLGPNISSISCSQTSPQYPVLKHLLNILFSNISSISCSQTSPQYPVLKHLLNILVSNISSISCSQTSPQYPVLKHLLNILFSNTLDLCSSLRIRDQVSHSGKIIVLYTGQFKKKVTLSHVYNDVTNEPTITRYTTIVRKTQSLFVIEARKCYKQTLRVFLTIDVYRAHWLLHYKHVKVLPSFWIALCFNLCVLDRTYGGKRFKTEW
jgi:hypothetical protein